MSALALYSYVFVQLFLGANILGRSTTAEKPLSELPKILKAKVPTSYAESNELNKMKSERFKLAMEELKHAFYREWASSNIELKLEYAVRLHDISIRLMKSFQSMSPTKDEVVALQTDVVELMKYVEKSVLSYQESGSVRKEDAARVKYFRVNAEIELFELTSVK